MTITDSKIIKGLECCLNCDCKNCPCQTEDGHCMGIDEALILDLINRQEIEIERLKAENEGYKHLDTILRTAIDELTANIKSEAIREFAERLKVKAAWDDKDNTVVHLDDIDSVVKEMMEVLDECN